jgi:hypothetical protein
LENQDLLLGNLTGSLTPIRDLAVRLRGPDTQTDAVSGALCISQRPKVAPGAYALWIFPGIAEGLVSVYEEIHHCHVVELYRQFLQCMNGAHLFEITLFGIPPSMARRPPQLDRSTAWPMDIGTAQENWRLDYPSSSTDFFIGYGPYSDDEHLGYFLWPNGGIEALRRNGDRHGQWNDLRSFLTDEIARAEAVYPKYEETMHSILRKSTGWRGLLTRFTGRTF